MSQLLNEKHRDPPDFAAVCGGLHLSAANGGQKPETMETAGPAPQKIIGECRTFFPADHKKKWSVYQAAVIRAATVREWLVFDFVGGWQTSHPRRLQGGDVTSNRTGATGSLSASAGAVNTLADKSPVVPTYVGNPSFEM